MITDMQPHIRLGKEHRAEYAILPGDPQRVERVKRFLDQSTDIAYNREFKSITGYYQGVKVLVTSTGIGGPSTGIAIEELNNLGVKTLIRIGSCGALQSDIKLGDLVIASGAVRNDGASDAYIEKGYPAIPDPEVLMTLVQTAKNKNITYHCGRIRSHDSFYTDREKDIDTYWSGKGILAADMESSILYTLGGLRNIRVASILNVVVEQEGHLENGINQYVDGGNPSSQGEENQILTALEAIAFLDKQSIKEKSLLGGV